MRNVVVIMLVCACLKLFTGATSIRLIEHNPSDFILGYFQVKYNKKANSLLFVGAKRQRMYLIQNGELKKVYEISTSRYGCGQLNKSEKTPLGLHKIQSRIGKNTPLGGVLVGSSYTGKIAQIESDPKPTGKDELTTRAMRLEGLESGLNKGGKNDTFNREIYIHGTPEEGLIGSPASHGCIRMRNKDVAELFDLVDEKTYVLILEN